MGIFDDIGKKITQTGQSTVQKAKDFAEVSKLNTQINDEISAMNNYCMQIGRKYYDLYRSNPQDEFAELCGQITASGRKIQVWKEEVQKIKNVRRCPSCNGENDYESKFCRTCGAKLEDDDAPNAAEPGARHCVVCGAQLNEGAQFCVGCGAKTGDAAADTDTDTDAGSGESDEG